MQAAYLGIPKTLFDDYYRDTCAIGKKDRIAFLKANSAYSIKPSLQNTKARVHIVFGSKEQSAIRLSARILSQRISNSTAESMPGYRHGDLSIHHPAQYAQMISDLVS